MAHIVKFASYGTPEVLEFKDVPDPQPAAGEVRIRVNAIGLNRGGKHVGHGEYIETANLPARLGYEAAGTVDAFAAGSTGAKRSPLSIAPSRSTKSSRLPAPTQRTF